MMGSKIFMISGMFFFDVSFLTCRQNNFERLVLQDHKSQHQWWIKCIYQQTPGIVALQGNHTEIQQPLKSGF